MREKSTDQIIKEMYGIIIGAKDLTPMDKGECKKCMVEYANHKLSLIEEKWISIEDELPEEGEKVLGVNIHGEMFKVYLTKGISLEEREKMKNGEIDDPFIEGTFFNARRSTSWYGEDESDCNKKPYNWKGVGPMSFCGQAILYWQPLPKPPKN